MSSEVLPDDMWDVKAVSASWTHQAIFTSPLRPVAPTKNMQTLPELLWHEHATR